jgi:hypothetical protein
VSFLKVYKVYNDLNVGDYILGETAANPLGIGPSTESPTKKLIKASKAARLRRLLAKLLC